MIELTRDEILNQIAERQIEFLNEISGTEIYEMYLKPETKKAEDKEIKFWIESENEDLAFDKDFENLICLKK